MSHRDWALNALLALAIFLLNVALNGPLFMPGEMVYRDSIEGGYASMARFVAQHPNPWGWNPTQYCGLPTQFTYLPGLPYFTALWIRLLPGLEPEYVYRLVASTLACLGPVTLFLLALYFTRSRWWALGVAVAYTLCSPAYGLIQQIDNDRGRVFLPWRMQLLAKYGEGPHNAGLTLMPLALMAFWAAAVGRKYWQVLVAAILLAVVALTNWVAALALAFCCLMMLFAAGWTGQATGFRMRRALAAVGLAYLLACFWLTPGFIQTIAFNWPKDAFNYRLQVQQIRQLAGLVGGLLLLRLLFQRFPRRSYLCFVALSFFGFSYVVLSHYWYGNPTIPESRRYAVELEMFLFLLLFEAFRQAMQSRFRPLHVGAVGLALALLWPAAQQAWATATKGYAKWHPIPKEETIEHRLAQWLADRNPTGRVFASGGVRFRLNSWFDLDQVGGTFESGLRNRIPVDFAYQARSNIGSPPGREGHDAILQLKAMRVEYVVVNGPRSKEHYRDFKTPWKFEGLLEKVFSEEDDRIYRMPVAATANLVRPAELPRHPPIHGYLEFLKPYVAAMDDAARPKLATAWRGTSGLDIEGAAPEGMLVAVQVSYDEGWEATQDGRSIVIEPDQLGFITLKPRPAASTRIELRYRGTVEQRLMAAISAMAWMAAMGTLVWTARRSAAPTTPR